MLGGGFADGVNSGTSAVYVALRALDPPAFGEVIVPPSTDAGGVMPVPLTNCIPVPADSAPGSFNTDAVRIEARLSERTSGIIVAHIGGIPADLDPILELARARDLPVIEDCAQAHGARYKGRPVGSLGDLAAFSTMFGKHHAAIGRVQLAKLPRMLARRRRVAAVLEDGCRAVRLIGGLSLAGAAAQARAEAVDWDGIATRVVAAYRSDGSNGRLL